MSAVIHYYGFRRDNEPIVHRTGGGDSVQLIASDWQDDFYAPLVGCAILADALNVDLASEPNVPEFRWIEEHCDCFAREHLHTQTSEGFILRQVDVIAWARTHGFPEPVLGSLAEPSPAGHSSSSPAGDMGRSS